MLLVIVVIWLLSLWLVNCGLRVGGLVGYVNSVGILINWITLVLRCDFDFALMFGVML